MLSFVDQLLQRVSGQSPGLFENEDPSALIPVVTLLRTRSS
jgi:hypothetical protein